MDPPTFILIIAYIQMPSVFEALSSLSHKSSDVIPTLGTYTEGDFYECLVQKSNMAEGELNLVETLGSPV
jgi:hypothetical protein